MRWLLLLHQIPPQPPYFRAKVMRRLNQIGAAALKNSAYLLPFSEDAVEDFEWLRKEIRADGGQCWVFQAESIQDEEFVEIFRRLRSADYRELASELKAGADRGKAGRRLEEIAQIDFFQAPGREEVETL